MELHEIKNGLKQAHLLLQEFYQSIDIPAYKREMEGLTRQTLEDHFWDDVAKAQQITDTLASMSKIVDTYDSLQQKYAELMEVFELVKETKDDEFTILLESDYSLFQKDLKSFENSILLSKKYDQANAIVEIHPGAGGTESQDWAEMLFRMYQRFGERKSYTIEVLDYLEGEVAGIKSVSFLVKGKAAYGYFKAEKGVHRLVRISPFDSAKRRHTSFAAVDVIPEVDRTINVTIKPEDIAIDTYRSSGAGGQHVNTTDSAVRITHKPTGIVVTCQSQRSQIQNREKAMMMLQSKLYQVMMEQQLDAIKDIKGKQNEIAWGSQIRSYVLHPYSLVKDTRSQFESTNPKDILDGNLEDCIAAYLKWSFREQEL